MGERKKAARDTKKKANASLHLLLLLLFMISGNYHHHHNYFSYCKRNADVSEYQKKKESRRFWRACQKSRKICTKLDSHTLLSTVFAKERCLLKILSVKLTNFLIKCVLITLLCMCLCW